MRRRKVGRNLSNTLLWVMASLKVVAVLVYLWELSVEFKKRMMQWACKFGGHENLAGRETHEGDLRERESKNERDRRKERKKER